jgi:hypothetical protein
MTRTAAASELIEVPPTVTNEEFLRQYAAPGRIGLVGGTTLIDRAICRAQRHVDDEKQWSIWSHAFLVEGERVDGRQWVIESDLDIHRKHIRLGVQENRIDKFFNQDFYSTLAILDFQLTPDQLKAVLRTGLDLVADHTRYSLRELFGALAGLKSQPLRAGANLLSRERSFFCSAFVQHLFRGAGIDLVPGLDVKHTTPEDLARSAVPHKTYLLKREVAQSTLNKLKTKLTTRTRARN